MASVLLIETQAPLMRLTAWFLLEAGFEVTKAEGVDDGLLKVAETRPSVIIFNTGIDGVRKTQAISQLRDASPQSHILDVSDVPETTDRPTFSPAQIQRFLRKYQSWRRVVTTISPQAYS